MFTNFAAPLGRAGSWLAGLCLLAAAALDAGAQEISTVPILRIEAGMHTTRISQIAVDRSGRLALTSSNDKTARLWDLPSGRLIRVLRPPVGEDKAGELYCAALSPDGTLAAVGGFTSPFGSADFPIYLFDTATGRMLHRMSGSPDATAALTFSANGRFLASIGAGLRIWDAATGRKIAEDVTYVREGYGLDWSSDGRLLTACYDGFLRLYQFGAGGLSGTLAPFAKGEAKGGKIPHRARFSPDGSKIAVGFADTNKVAVLDGNNLSFLFAPDTAGITGRVPTICWSSDGSALFGGGMWATTDGQTHVRRWPAGGRGKPKDITVTRDTLIDLQALPGNDVLFASVAPAWGIIRASSSAANAQLSTAPLGPNPAPDYRGMEQQFRISDDGETLAFGYGYKGTLPAGFSIADREISFFTKSRPVSKSLRPPRITGLNLTDCLHHPQPKLNKQPIPMFAGDTAHSFAIARDASSFLLGSEFMLRSFTPQAALQWSSFVPGTVWAANYAENVNVVVAALGDGSIRWYRMDTGLELMGFFPHADRQRWILWSTEYRIEKVGAMGAGLQMLNGKVAVTGVDANSAAARAGLLVGDEFITLDGTPAIDVNATIAFIRKRAPGDEMKLRINRKGQEQDVAMKLGERMANFGPKAFYYDCSTGAEGLIGWHVNRGKDEAADFFPAAKFREQFYRPDVVRQVLAKGDVAAAVRAANEIAGRRLQAPATAEAVLAKMAPPIVELTVGGARGETALPAGASDFAVRYRVRRGGSEAITRVRVLVDGRPAQAESAIPASDTAEAEVKIAVPERDCVVAVLAENRFAVSEPATLRLLRAQGSAPESDPLTSPATPAAAKPKLYLLAVGVADLKMNDAHDVNGDGRVGEDELQVRDPSGTVPFGDLHFADADARDVAKSFAAQEGLLYGKVETRVLVNKEATAPAIKDGLEWIKGQTTARDVAVIFLSGHGENDNEGRFYFLSHEYDQKRRLSTGVSFSEIEQTIKDPAGKMVFFIDSCHAGNALGKMFAAKGGAGSVDINRLVNELAAAENGAIVFASSTGRQQSLESSELKHGVFAQAIIEGLGGKADVLGKGRINISGLEAYVCDRVKEYTEGRQTPTVAKPQTVPDFPIAVKR